MKIRLSAQLKRWFSVAFSVGFLIWIAQQMDWRDLNNVSASISGRHFLFALSLPLWMSIPHVLRWQWASVAIGATLGFFQGLRLVFVGYFFNQILPTSFGGDAFRIWGMHKEGVSISRSILSVLLDRVIAFFMLCFLFIVSYPWLRQQIDWPELEWLWISLFLCFIGGILAYLLKGFLSKWLKAFSFTQRLADLLEKPIAMMPFFKSCVMALIIHLGVGLTFYILAQGLALPLSLATCCVIFPLINLVTMIPLSFAGWGIREGVLVFALSYFNIQTEQAFLLSVGYGLVVTIAALPGVLLWLKGHYSFRTNMLPTE